MKICIAEAMKRVKELDAEKRLLNYKEEQECTISYREGEEKTAQDYDYAKTRARMKEIDDETRRVKFLIAKANIEVKLDGFDVTIAEGLVLLAQLRAELSRLDNLTGHKQISRRITSTGVIEYTECLFDVAKAEEDQLVLGREIGRLQVAIDKANFVSEIEI